MRATASMLAYRLQARAAKTGAMEHSNETATQLPLLVGALVVTLRRRNTKPKKDFSDCAEHPHRW